MKIYTITMVETIVPIDNSDPQSWPEFKDRRCVGFYKNYNDAIYATMICNLHRDLYEYCIIEEINEGVFKDTSKRWILKREGTNKDNYIYVPIEEPKEIAKVRNFGIG